MKRVELIEWIKSKGFKEDRWDNFRKTKSGNLYRFKLMKTIVRYERAIKLEYPTKDGKKKKTVWVVLSKAKYKDLFITTIDKKQLIYGFKKGAA